jgi:hypothetical protein
MQPYSADSAHLADSSGAFPEDAGTADDSRRPALGRGPDRRRTPTPRFSLYALFGGRRTQVRREGEREGTFVDRYRRGVVLLIAWTALMNAGDSTFTLIHLQSGGIELNPVAEFLLQTGRVGFVLTKAFFITLALLVLVLHKNFVLARWGLFVAAGTYTLLNVYHLSLFF